MFIGYKQKPMGGYNSFIKKEGKWGSKLTDIRKEGRSKLTDIRREGGSKLTDIRREGGAN